MDPFTHPGRLYPTLRTLLGGYIPPWGPPWVRDTTLRTILGEKYHPQDLPNCAETSRNDSFEQKWQFWAREESLAQQWNGSKGPRGPVSRCRFCQKGHTWDTHTVGRHTREVHTREVRGGYTYQQGGGRHIHTWVYLRVRRVHTWVYLKVRRLHTWVYPPWWKLYTLGIPTVVRVIHPEVYPRCQECYTLRYTLGAKSVTYPGIPHGCGRVLHTRVYLPGCVRGVLTRVYVTWYTSGCTTVSHTWVYLRVYKNLSHLGIPQGVLRWVSHTWVYLRVY